MYRTSELGIPFGVSMIERRSEESVREREEVERDRA
jgi:hypothetical protein